MFDPSKTGLAGFVRSEAPGWQRAGVAVVLLPFWLTSEIRQSSMQRNGRYAALAGLWVGTLVISAASANPSGPKDQPESRPPLVTPKESPGASQRVVTDESACLDFASRGEAQTFYVDSGGPAQDPHGLDADGNGQACESLSSGPVETPQLTPIASSSADPMPVTPHPQIEATGQPPVAPTPEPVYTPPPDTPAPTQASNCDPNYSGCLDPNAEDYDCAGGSGNGPKYVQGPVQVYGDDHYGLDADHDGVGCEDN